jgi:hypothetical protein
VLLQFVVMTIISIVFLLAELLPMKYTTWVGMKVLSHLAKELTPPSLM